MRPVIRLVNNLEVGTLTGTVHDDLANADVCDDPWVYVFNNTVTPNGTEEGVEDAEDPIATAMVKQQENSDGSMTWNYTVGFLLEGDYEAAFTCNNADFAKFLSKFKGSIDCFFCIISDNSYYQHIFQ